MPAPLSIFRAWYQSTREAYPEAVVVVAVSQRQANYLLWTTLKNYVGPVYDYGAPEHSGPCAPGVPAGFYGENALRLHL